MSEESPRERLRENAVTITSLVVTGLWLGLFLSGVGGSLWLVVLVVGYAALIPLVTTLYGDEEELEQWGYGEEPTADEADRSERGDERSEADALETLRERYARGELTDEQFERKLERLVEIGDLEDAEDWARRRDAGRAGTDGSGDREGSSEGREPAYERG